VVRGVFSKRTRVCGAGGLKKTKEEKKLAEAGKAKVGIRRHSPVMGESTKSEGTTLSSDPDLQSKRGEKSKTGRFAYRRNREKDCVGYSRSQDCDNNV